MLFRDAVFKGNAAFDGASLGDEACLSGCAFSGPASFKDVRFKGEADFSGTRFAAPVRFHHARFRAPASFESARFGATADFSGLRTDSVLTLCGAAFASAPDFLNTRLGQPPRLETMRIKAPMRRFRRWQGTGQRDPRPWLFRLMAVARDHQEAARFRQLRHLARAGLDHEREGAFYADEIRASRFWRQQAAGGAARAVLARVGSMAALRISAARRCARCSSGR